MVKTELESKNSLSREDIGTSILCLGKPGCARSHMKRRLYELLENGEGEFISEVDGEIAGVFIRPSQVNRGENSTSIYGSSIRQVKYQMGTLEYDERKKFLDGGRK